MQTMARGARGVLDRKRPVSILEHVEIAPLVVELNRAMSTLHS
jgi:hypothetical protein